WRGRRAVARLRARRAHLPLRPGLHRARRRPRRRPGGHPPRRARPRRAGYELPHRRPIDRGDLHRARRPPAIGRPPPRRRARDASRDAIGIRTAWMTDNATPSPTPAGATGSGFARRTVPNITAVARREFMSRARTRTFRITTVVLVLAGLGLALAPVLFQWLEGESTGDRVEVVVSDASPNLDVVTALGQILNAPSGPSIPVAGQDVAPKFLVVAGTDLATARAHVIDGSSFAALALARTPDAAGDLAFDLYSKDGAISRKVQLIRQAAISIAIQDRLTRAGVSPIDQAHLFTPPNFEVLPADPNAHPRVNPNSDPTAFLVGF